MPLQHKNFPATLLPVSDDTPGLIEAIVAVTNNVDRGGERIRPGFFAKSLARQTPKGVWGHDWLQPIAKTLAAEEWPAGDPRLPPALAALGGYYIKALFNLDTQRGHDAYSDVKFGIVDQFSIGYHQQKTEWQAEEKVLDLVEGEWYEWSPVLVGMNPATALLAVKADATKDAGDDEAGETPEMDLWEAVSLLQSVLYYVQQRRQLLLAEPDSLALALALLPDMAAVLDDLQAALPDAPAAAAGPQIKVARLVPDRVFAREARMAVAVVQGTLAKAERQAANRRKDGRTISATNHAALTAMHADLGAVHTAMGTFLSAHAPADSPTPEADPPKSLNLLPIYLDFLKEDARRNGVLI